MMVRVLVMVALLGGRGAPARGQTPSALDEAVRLGTVAALAPLCGLRDEGWAFDLRRAAILDATRTGQPDDSALKAAPGSDTVVGALSFAEAEALESFAEAAPGQTCGPLARDPELFRADGLVAAFRELRARVKPQS